LPSYVLSSLEETQSNLDGISRDEKLFPLDMNKIAAASREWTETLVDTCLAEGEDRPISHYDLENKHQISSEPQGRSYLSSFNFMRHVELWNMELREIVCVS
jgi:hypothetical protein